MSRDYTWNQNKAEITGIRNWMKRILLILLILIGLLISILAYHGITDQERSRAVKAGPISTSGEQTKLLFNIR